MDNFYDKWLRLWDDEQKERSKGRTYINEEDLEWVRTKQDYKAALLCSRENGFVTAGDVTTAIIPKGWHTGKHSHGEEAMYIIQGKGFSDLDGERYDWEAGSCLFMPFGSIHQHFNAGDEEIRYISVMGIALERFTGLAKFVQYEEAGETALRQAEEIRLAKTDIHPDYGRIVLREKDAPIVRSTAQLAKRAEKEVEFYQTMPKEMKTPGAHPHNARTISLMSAPENQFKAREIEMTAVLINDPGQHTGKHAHMEAILYVLDGEGYSVVDSQQIPWKKGTLLQVQGPHTVHQHFNTGQVESRHLRIHFGIRSKFFQAIAQRTFPYQYYEFSSYGD